MRLVWACCCCCCAAAAYFQRISILPNTRPRIISLLQQAFPALIHIWQMKSMRLDFCCTSQFLTSSRVTVRNQLSCCPWWGGSNGSTISRALVNPLYWDFVGDL
ncbi:hypothetical protein BKA61DRAFT_231068 [Leptodontidium sp. MPI-SDFR-AT-0119]|nr:hypothetical protein BKA61DRAFT_231068 [Leptodontidium sp. MPI-SDFR-AT-0119]